MHSYLSVVLVELAVKVMKLDTGIFYTPDFPGTDWSVRQAKRFGGEEYYHIYEFVPFL